MTWPWDVFEGAVDVLEATIALPWVLADMLVNLVMTIFYPVVVGVSVVQTVFQAMWADVAGLLNVLIGIPNLLIDLINALFVGTLPYNWLALISIQIFIVLGLRLYAFIKDINILGNSL